MGVWVGVWVVLARRPMPSAWRAGQLQYPPWPTIEGCEYKIFDMYKIFHDAGARQNCGCAKGRDNDSTVPKRLRRRRRASTTNAIDQRRVSAELRDDDGAGMLTPSLRTSPQ